MESFKDRLRRFLFGSVHEIPETILNSIHNNFLTELHKAGEQELWLLVLLGTHAIMQTVGKTIFGLQGLEATTFYLREFVDGGPPDRTYSSISKELHLFRNAVAHEWMSSLGHYWGFDEQIPGGFEKRGTIIHFKTSVYLQHFTAGFSDGRIYNYERLASDDDLLIRKYEFIAEWLKLPKDTIRKLIKGLQATAPGPDRGVIEKKIQADLKARYAL